MNAKELFKIYFSKQLIENKGTLLLVILSLIISFSISIFVPIISYNQNIAVINNVDKINGGDLKIEGNMVLKDIEDELLKIDDNAEMKKIHIVSSFIKSESDNKFVFDLLIGDYNLDVDEIVLSTEIANSLGYSVGDEVEVSVYGNYKKFKIKETDDMNYGVSSQAEFIGYGKISEKYLPQTTGEPNLVIINSKSANIIKEQFTSKFSNLKFKTVEDTRVEQESTINMQRVAMNLLNAMGYILMISILAGTTIMFLIKYRRDISILKLLSIENKVIKRGLFIEFFSIGVIPLLLSLPVSYIVLHIISNFLKIQNNSIDSDIIILMIRGFVINIVIFTFTIKVLSSAVTKVSPVSLLNKQYTELYNKLKQTGLILIPLIIVSIFMYGIFVGESMIFMSFLMIMALALILFLILTLIFFIITKISVKNEVLNYTNKTFKYEKGINTILILNMALLLIFFLIGFSFPNLLKSTYDDKVEKDLPYNYMIASKDINNAAAEVEEKLGGDGVFTLISTKNASMVFGEKIIDILELGIDLKNYNNQFKIIEGKELSETEKNGVLISSTLKSQENLNLDDEIQISTKGKVERYYIRGIYENATINSNWILKSDTNRKEASMMLLKTDREITDLELSDSVIGSLAQVSKMMLNKVEEFLLGFRYICIIFSGSALLFNILLVTANNSMKKRDFTIIKALSKGELFIKKSIAINFLYGLIISSVCAISTYWILGIFVFKFILNVEMTLDSRTMIITIFLTTLFNFITYFQVFFKTDKFIDYSLLRSE